MAPPKDPEKYKLYVERQKAAREHVLADPEFRKRFTERMRENNSDPNWRKSNSEGQKKIHADPERRKGFDAAMKKRSENIEWRERLTKHNRKISSDPFYQEKHSKAMVGLMMGERNPRWRGGITPLGHQIRTSKQYLDWRDAIFKRDNYCDFFSGVRGGNYLNAHHIIPFNKIVKRERIKTFDDAMKCKALWDIDNGMTMIESSHRAYHEIWGNID
jgi:hypothetical protein